MELNASVVQHKGIKESQGKTSYELDWNFIEEMSKRMDANKGKYPPYNWHKPIDINSLKQAVARHHTQFQLGNYEDDGQPYGHILGIACNLMMIYYQLTEIDKQKSIRYFIDGKPTTI